MMKTMPAWAKALVILLAVTAALAVLVRALEPRLAFFPTPGVAATPAALGMPFKATAIPTRDGGRCTPGCCRTSRRARVVYFHCNGGNFVWCRCSPASTGKGMPSPLPTIGATGSAPGPHPKPASIATWTRSSSGRPPSGSPVCPCCSGGGRSARRWPRMRRRAPGPTA